MQTDSWMKALWGWPMIRTLRGPGKRDLTRLAAILVALDEAYGQSDRLFAPANWVFGCETQRHEQFREQMQELIVFQLRMFKKHDFKEGPVPFDLFKAQVAQESGISCRLPFAKEKALNRLSPPTCLMRSIFSSG